MKTEFIDITQTQKNLLVEIPSDVVEAEIDRVTRDYTRQAKIPGFRPGKVPPKVVRQRFRDQILHEVAHELIPRAVDEALRARGVEPVDSPDIRDVVVEEGQPLKFTATFETVPPIDPGDYAAISLRRPPVELAEEEIDQALEQMRERAARYDPIEDRAVDTGDTVQLDLRRTALGPEPDRAADGSEAPDAATPRTEHHENITVEIGAAANPPGFDEQLTGMRGGEQKTFSLTYPEEYAVRELAGTAVEYGVTLRGIKRRNVPALDDEFAKDMGDFDTLDALRARVREDLRHHKEHEADHVVRGDLLKQLASRVTGGVPAALVDREIDRRLEEFVRRLIEQQIDPMRANINWEEFRERQREPATDAVKSALVLDEIARREQIAVSDEDVEREIERYAERSGRTPAAVRARLEKEGGISRLYSGLRRERAIDFLLSRARIVHA
ncbi:MAG TPA: trigger factor [Vicinamibacterales bacterium]|nr:trigger factor [Vicinamibacterales bacterium]